MFPGLWELIIMSYRVMQRNRVRFHGPAVRFAFVILFVFAPICISVPVLICVKNFCKSSICSKTWSGIMIMHVRDGTEQTETKQCLTHFLKRLRRNKQQRQTGKRIKDKFRKNRKEARDE